jgi:hypothetical protein
VISSPGEVAGSEIAHTDRTVAASANESDEPLIAWAKAEACRLRGIGNNNDGLTVLLGVSSKAVVARPVVAAALEFLRKNSPGSHFLDSAEGVVSWDSNAVPKRAILAVAGLLDDWVRFTQDGMAELLPFPVLARMEAATDLMGQVQQLLDESTIHPAAPVVLAGAALEEFLRSQIAAAALEPKGKPGIATYANALRNAGLLTGQDVKDITAWAGQRNEAAHGQFGNLSPARAQIMVDGINLFIRQNTPSN